MLTLLIILSYWWNTTNALANRSFFNFYSLLPVCQRATAAKVSATHRCHHNSYFISGKGKNKLPLVSCFSLGLLTGAVGETPFFFSSKAEKRRDSILSAEQVEILKMEGQQRQQPSQPHHQRSIPVPPPRRKSPTVVTTTSSLEDKDTISAMPSSSSYSFSSHSHGHSYQSGGLGGESSGHRRITSELRISPPMMHSGFPSCSTPTSPTIITTLSPQSDTGIVVMTRGGSVRETHSGSGGIGGFVQSGRPLMPSKSLKLHSTHRRSSQCRRFRKRMKAHRLFMLLIRYQTTF